MKKFKTYFEFSSIKLEISGDELSIHSISFFNPAISKSSKEGIEIGLTDVMLKCKEELKKYFEGNLKVFTVPYQLEGTEFQKRVWNELNKIQYGETISYLELAKRLGDEKTIRAAASANGKNRIGIIIPCHRVIGSNGSLTGYAGGIQNKKLLLELEKKNSRLEDGLF
jgi:methylated-DNA-[protein]-cysteine S-methyltransferase